MIVPDPKLTVHVRCREREAQLQAARAVPHRAPCIVPRSVRADEVFPLERADVTRRRASHHRGLQPNVDGSDVDHALLIAEADSACILPFDRGFVRRVAAAMDVWGVSPLEHADG